ncbi:uncharacterized protein LOC124499685 [Dermatophagoides farinae]|uniref:F-box domain-containing protein n=1 Tax=Dermatophagoides farinae TaxID=6954 RepID=A0A9D4P939_DERFA|nr:uncharacterized protein LOC124499685 [Dermatophagoides farinae]KAH7646212.1 hypothetical protein HUG17_1750 [Dermatophagoides farinae]
MDKVPVELWMKIFSSLTNNDLLSLRLVNHHCNDIVLQCIQPIIVYFRYITPGSKNFQAILQKDESLNNSNIHYKIFYNHWKKFQEFSKVFEIEHLCIENLEDPIYWKSILENDELFQTQLKTIFSHLKSLRFKNCLNFEILKIGWEIIVKTVKKLYLNDCFLINNNFDYYSTEKINSSLITTLDLQGSRLNDKIFYNITKHLNRLKHLNCANTRMRFYFHLIRRSYFLLTSLNNIDFQPVTTYAFTYCALSYYLNQIQNESNSYLEEIQIGPLLNVENLTDLISCSGSKNLRKIHLWFYEMDFDARRQEFEKNFSHCIVKIIYHRLPCDIQVKI